MPNARNFKEMMMIAHDISVLDCSSAGMLFIAQISRQL